MNTTVEALLRGEQPLADDLLQPGDKVARRSIVGWLETNDETA